MTIYLRDGYSSEVIKVKTLGELGNYFNPMLASHLWDETMKSGSFEVLDGERLITCYNDAKCVNKYQF